MTDLSPRRSDGLLGFTFTSVRVKVNLEKQSADRNELQVPRVWLPELDDLQTATIEFAGATALVRRKARPA